MKIRVEEVGTSRTPEGVAVPWMDVSVDLIHPVASRDRAFDATRDEPCEGVDNLEADAGHFSDQSWRDLTAAPWISCLRYTEALSL